MSGWDLLVSVVMFWNNIVICCQINLPTSYIFVSVNQIRPSKFPNTLYWGCHYSLLLDISFVWLNPVGLLIQRLHRSWLNARKQDVKPSTKEMEMLSKSRWNVKSSTHDMRFSAAVWSRTLYVLGSNTAPDKCVQLKISCAIQFVVRWFYMNIKTAICMFNRKFSVWQFLYQIRTYINI